MEKGGTSKKGQHKPTSTTQFMIAFTFNTLPPIGASLWKTMASERNQFKQKQFATIYLISVDIP